MKFGVLILYFNAERTILRCIENCSPFVNRIYVSYSSLPWSAYNPEARSRHHNQSSKEVLRQSPHLDKIRLIEGTWNTEQDQRNAIVEIARSEGIDVLIIQDPDEFYLPASYRKNLAEIEENPEYPFYYNPWVNFWKDLGHIVLERRALFGKKYFPYSESANFAINLRHFPDVHFKDRRLSNYSYDQGLKLSGLCYHLSYVYSDEEVRAKIETWGHSHQVQANWMQYKWLGWRPSSIYINPTLGPVWHRAIPFNGELPGELIDFPKLEQTYAPLSFFQRLDEWVYNFRQVQRYWRHEMKGIIARRFGLGQYKKAS